MKENLFFLIFMLLTISLIIALISYAINQISAYLTRTKEKREHKKAQAAFLKKRAEETAKIETLAKQTVCYDIYGSQSAYYFTNCIITAIHLFDQPQTPVLCAGNCKPFNTTNDYKLLLSAVHPDSHFPSKGYPLHLEKVETDVPNKCLKVWFAPYNNTISGFVVQKVNERTISLLHGRFGSLCLPIPKNKNLNKGDHVKVMQSSSLTDSGYLVRYYIV